MDLAYAAISLTTTLTALNIWLAKIQMNHISYTASSSSFTLSLSLLHWERSGKGGPDNEGLT